MFCIVTRFGCDKHRLKFNLLVRMKPHFMPLALAFCLLILQGYQVCMSSDHKQPLDDDSPNPSGSVVNTKSRTEPAVGTQNDEKDHKKVNLHQSMHHSFKTNQAPIRHGPQKRHQGQQRSTRDNIKQHTVSNSQTHNKNNHDHMTDIRGREEETNKDGSTNSDNVKSLDQVYNKVGEANDVDRNVIRKGMNNVDGDDSHSDLDVRTEVKTSQEDGEKVQNVNKADRLTSEESSNQESQINHVLTALPHHFENKDHVGIYDTKPTSADSLDAEENVKVVSEREHKDEVTRSEGPERVAKHEESSQQLDIHDDVSDEKVTLDVAGSGSSKQTTPSGEKDVPPNKDSRSALDEAISTDQPVLQSDQDQPSEEKISHQGDTGLELPSVRTEEAASSKDGVEELLPKETLVDESLKEAGDSKRQEQPEIIKVPETTDDNLPSFDEWKQKMLAEQAEQEKTKIQEVQNMQPISAMPPNNKKGTKNVNYASVTCGAKIRASNPEAQHPGFILTENKDQYMINPCKVKKWFVVELCTPVQIQALEIGNLELFSSLPESFLVQVSEGFPTKDWKPVGTFHARNDRTVQSFMVENEQMYAHYIRVEMLSHYGTEHYCPLTVLRVFGVTVIEADEAEEDVPIAEDTDEMPIQDAEKDLTLFSSATDTVINLVKTMLSQGEEKDGNKQENDTLMPETLTDAVEMKTDVANSSAKNITEEQVQDDHMEPCMPEVRSNEDATITKPVMMPTGPQVPDVTVDKVLEPEPVQGAPLPEVPAVQDDSVDRQPDIVTLIERPVIPLTEFLINCHYCYSDTRPACYSDRQSVCGYYRILIFIPPMCCIKPLHIKEAEVDDFNRVLAEPELVTTSASTSVTRPETAIPPIETIQTVSFEQDETVIPSQYTVINEASRFEMPIKTPPLTVIHHTESAIQTESSTIQMSSTDPCTDSTTSKILTSESLVVPETSEIKPSVTIPDMSDGLSEVSTDQTKEALLDVPDVNPSKGETPQETTVVPEDLDVGSSNGLPDIYAEEPTNQNVDADIDTTPTQSNEDIQYQKITIGKKETTFMKLKNKIRSLELNLNLSSQYLEQLSQRYRKQMEEMYISLNRTITKLADTSRKAEEKDVKQQEHIANLLRQIKALNSSFESMKGNISVIHLELIERHLYLMIIEAAIFLLVLAWCLHRQEKNIRNLQDRTERMVAVGSSGTVSKLKPTKCVRRNSTDNTPTRPKLDSSVMLKRRAYDDCDIRKSGSENNISRILPSSLGFANTGSQQGEAVKRKKKKRTSNPGKTLPFGHLIGTSLTNSISTSCQSFSAELSTDMHRPSFSVNGTYTGHAPKRRDVSSGAKGHEINGHVVRPSSDTASLNVGDQQEEIGETFRRHSSEHLIRQKTSHRKTPSLDRNLYSSLAVVNGVNDSDGNSDNHGLTFRDYKDIIRKQS